MPPQLLQYVPMAALAISLLALFVSFANLGWNMYRELALRGRLRVKFAVKEIVGGGMPQMTRVFVSATNFGPGSVKVNMIVYKEAPLWRIILRCVKRGVIIYDYTDPMNVRLPHKLDVSDSIDQVLKYGPEFIVSPKTTHIGFSDNFRRYHWAPRRDLREFRDRFEKDFPGLTAKHMAEENKRAQTKENPPRQTD
jgi:hypothetical protein